MPCSRNQRPKEDLKNKHINFYSKISLKNTHPKIPPRKLQVTLIISCTLKMPSNLFNTLFAHFTDTYQWLSSNRKSKGLFLSRYPVTGYESPYFTILSNVVVVVVVVVDI